ncbi:hypothetical protein H8M03_06540 [Sphingomonas sabuli]|uniref:DUF2946 domain-containing protein n=1 Tax=Sphingomonas sabuli TaxID=2764186 RepID=A0A7G9KZD2_9SPHN|nr:hypothetical protein [Sphingomonas sabuli]QNM81731.1 hypothetical protein H8M03_06540 [Sphingomonas sabuli]
MHKLAIRLLTLLAVMLMPFGMATAASPPPSSHAAMAEHCPDGQQAPSHHDGMVGECTMACASALPAAVPERTASDAVAPPVLLSAAIARLAGMELEIATPPPRLA